MTDPRTFKSSISPEQLRSLVHYINLLGKHVRQGNITEYEARILLSTEVRPFDKGPTHEIFNRVDLNLVRLLHSTPVKDFTIRYGEGKGDISIIVKRRLTHSSDEKPSFTI